MDGRFGIILNLTELGRKSAAAASDSRAQKGQFDLDSESVWFDSESTIRPGVWWMVDSESGAPRWGGPRGRE